jgi:hypothetical protein
MAQDLKTWLEGIPPEGEIDGRIGEVENELELLRAIKQVRAHSPVADRSPEPPPGDTEDALENGKLPADVEVLRRRLSDERIKILRAILRQKNARATIPEVVSAVDPNDRDNIASNLQRMVKARLVSRAGRGRYRVTPGAAQLVRSMDEAGEVD